MFIGRQPELQVLDSMLDDAGAGMLRIALISGGPGIGKTSLARAVGEHARRRGFTVLWGRLHEGREVDPYRLWQKVLRDWAWRNRKKGRTSEVAQRVPGAARTASTVIPELRLLVHAASEQAPPRPGLAESVAQVLCAAVAAEPTVLLLDNIHLASSEALSVLRSIAERERLSLLIAATSREAVDRAILADVPSKVISLSGFTPDEVAEFCRTVGPTGNGSLAAQVFNHTQGNPLLVAEVAELVRLEGSEALARMNPTEFWERHMAPRVLPMYRRRVRSLAVDRRRVLVAAAALGFEVDEQMLTLCLDGVTPAAVYAALREGSELGMLERCGHGPAAWST